MCVEQTILCVWDEQSSLEKKIYSKGKVNSCPCVHTQYLSLALLPKELVTFALSRIDTWLKIAVEGTSNFKIILKCEPFETY